MENLSNVQLLNGEIQMRQSSMATLIGSLFSLTSTNLIGINFHHTYMKFTVTWGTDKTGKNVVNSMLKSSSLNLPRISSDFNLY